MLKSCVLLTVLFCLSQLPSFPNNSSYFVNVCDFGAKGDGTEDATKAFQCALDTAEQQGGGIVFVPAGTFKILGTLKIPAGVTLQGTFKTPPNSHYPNKPQLVGSVLHAYAGRNQPDSEPFITLAGNNATLAGVIIYYPEWSPNQVPPTPYPPTVSAKNTENVGVIDCCIINPYEALFFQNSARMIIRNVFGYPSYRGLYIDACYDISRVENCHFWPFGVVYAPNDPYCLWINENAVAFEFARTDWQYVTHTFCFGYGVGYKFSRSKHGSCNGSFLGIGADCCKRAVLVEDLQPFGLLITNGEFVGRWESTDSAGIEILPNASEGKVSLVNCAFWGPLDRAIWHRSPKTQLTVMGTNFWEWDVNGKGSPAIQIDAGKSIIEANTFTFGLHHLLVGKHALSTIITSNQAEGGLVVSKFAGNKVQMAMNEHPVLPPKEKDFKNLVLNVGSNGDRYYLKNWYGPESGEEWNSPEATKRWTKQFSLVRLPILPKTPYVLCIKAYIPPQAKHPENKIYINQQYAKSFAELEGLQTIQLDVPPQEQDFVFIGIQSHTWRPKDIDPNAKDSRTLGIAVAEIQLRTRTAPKKPFILNSLHKSQFK